MSETTRPAVGAIGWADLTVNDAASVRDFYREMAASASSATPPAPAPR